MEDQFDVILTMPYSGYVHKAFTGSYEDCLDKLKSLINQGESSSTLDIRSCKTGRLMSWVI